MLSLCYSLCPFVKPPCCFPTAVSPFDFLFCSSSRSFPLLRYVLLKVASSFAISGSILSDYFIAMPFVTCSTHSLMPCSKHYTFLAVNTHYLLSPFPSHRTMRTTHHVVSRLTSATSSSFREEIHRSRVCGRYHQPLFNMSPFLLGLT